MFFKKLFVAGFALSSFSNSLSAQTMDEVAACAGVVAGNGAIDLFVGDEKKFTDAMDVAYYAYLPSANGTRAILNFTDEERAFTSKILSSNMDKMINAYNSENYDLALYEEIVGCYRTLGTVLLRPDIQGDLKMAKDDYDEVKEKTISNIRRLFSAQ